MTKQDEARNAFEAARMALVNASEAPELAAEAAFAACREAAEPEPEPDTQERIDEDARKGMYEYWKCGDADCDSCPATVDGRKPKDRYGATYCSTAQKLDLLRRQRELDAKEVEE